MGHCERYQTYSRPRKKISTVRLYLGHGFFLRDIATIYPLSILLGILYHVLSRIPREVLGVLRVKHASLVLTVR